MTTENSKARVLIVDSEEALLRAIERLLRDVFDVSTAGNFDEALALLERQAFDAVVADSKMPRGNGIDFLVTVRDRFPTVRRILYTGAPPEGVHRFIDEGTVQRCLLKPLGGHAFIAALKSELDLPRWNQR